MQNITYFVDSSFHKFNTPEYVTLMDRFISHTKAQGEEVLHYQKADFDRMQELFGQLQNNVARSMALAETPEIVALDAERTSLAQYIITTVRNAQSLPITTKANAAKQLYAMLRAYVGFYNQPAPQKTATIDGMLLDLATAEMQTHVTTLGLDDCIETLTLKNAQYKVKVETRTVSRTALHSAVDSATLRLEMDALYKNITTVIFAHNVITPSEEVNTYINAVNAVIAEITASYNQRTAARRKPAEDNEATGPQDNEDEMPDSEQGTTEAE